MERKSTLRKSTILYFFAENFCTLAKLFDFYIFIFARADVVNSECGKHIPCRRCAVVLIAGEAVVRVAERLLAELIDPIFALFFLTESGKQIGEMEARLIGNCTLTEIDRRHLRHFVNFRAVAARTINRRSCEKLVKLFNQLVLAAVKLGKSVNIVRNRER